MSVYDKRDITVVAEE